MKNICLTILLISQGFGGIADDLKSFYKRSGAVSNATSAGSFKDQSAGYYTGGGFVARTGVRNAQLATIQMPGFRAGCGGIDAWTGSFSYIDSKELIGMLRNVGVLGSYAFMLATQTFAPQLYNVMNELNSIATKINQANINSCEMAATMLGGVWPKSDQASNHLCQSMGRSFGAFSDWAQARHGCGIAENRNRVFEGKSNDSRYKEMFAGEFNIAWKAIQSNSFLASDKELAELFMTLVGSIIMRKNGDSLEISHLASHADRDDLITGLLTGGQTPIYVCDSTACLRPTLKNINLSADSGLFKKTEATLDKLVSKIYRDEAITPEEQGFLNATRMPVFKMLNVLTAFKKGSAPLDVHTYSELIALDILYKYIIEVLDLVQDSVAQLKAVQVDDSHIERFLNQLRFARSKIIEKRGSAYQQMDNTLSFIESTQVIEKQLYSAVGVEDFENAV